MTNPDAIKPVAWTCSAKAGFPHWTRIQRVAEIWRDQGCVVTALFSSEQMDAAVARGDALEAAVSEIANHLDAEPDSDSILHLVREAEADRDIFKAERDELRAVALKAQAALAMLIAPDAIKQTTVINAYAAAVEAEASLRAILSPKDHPHE